MQSKILKTPLRFRMFIHHQCLHHPSPTFKTTTIALAMGKCLRQRQGCGDGFRRYVEILVNCMSLTSNVFKSDMGFGFCQTLLIQSLRNMHTLPASQATHNIKLFSVDRVIFYFILFFSSHSSCFFFSFSLALFVPSRSFISSVGKRKHFIIKHPLCLFSFRTMAA